MERKLPLAAILIIIYTSLKSSHIQGGEMYYECISPNTYRITLKLYRNCSASSFDLQSVFTIFERNNGAFQFHDKISFFNSSIESVPINLNNPCLEPPTSICTEKATYSGIFTLPPNAEGYTIVYQRCCRDQNIINIYNPDSQGTSYVVNIPGNSVCNNSVRFDKEPPSALCINEPFVFDYSATDLDNDSIVYALSAPLAGGSSFNPTPSPTTPPTTHIIWEQGFSDTNQITASSNFKIDSVTGILTGTPSQLGVYVFGLVAKEYRNGILINENRIDYQFSVVNCSKVVQADFADQASFCGEQLTQTLTNTSLNASTYRWDFGVSGTLSDTSNAFSPTFTFPDTGKYDITLIVNEGELCPDTLIKTFHIKEALFADINILSNVKQCKSSSNYDFQVIGNFAPNANVTWNFGSGASQTTSNDIAPKNISYATAGVKTITVTVEENGCVVTQQKSISILEKPTAILTDEIICKDLTVNFQNLSTNTNSYSWDFGVIGSNTDTSRAASPVFTFPGSGDYLVTLIANPDSGCSDTATAWYRLKGNFDLNVDVGIPQCITNNSFDFNLTGKYSSNATFQWTFGSSASQPSSTVEQPQNIVFNTVGIHTVTLNIVDEGCAEFVEFEVTVYPEVSIDFEGETEGCTPVTVNFTDLSYSLDKLDYFWDFGDGNTSTEQHPIHTYENPGVYDVTLTVVSDTGCATTLTITKQNFVTVYEVPTANFDVTPQEVTVFHPEVTLTDYSRGGNFLYYVVDGVDTLYDPNTTYSFVESGDRMITLYIQNEFGCVTTLTKTVYVEPTTTAYVPNAFSPNGDGVNDFFIPVIKDVTEYELFIFNRWGNIIFNSTKLEEGWDGNNQNGNQAQQDVYVYRIRYRNVDGFFETKEGHVTLIK